MLLSGNSQIMQKTQVAYKLFLSSNVPTPVLGSGSGACRHRFLTEAFEFFQTELWFVPGVSHGFVFVFSIKDQTINILGFLGHMVTAIHYCCCTAQAATENT